MGDGRVYFGAKDDATVFEGTIRTANNGGFASARYRFPEPQNLSGATGFYMDVRSEPQGARFEFVLKDAECAKRMACSFKQGFRTTQGSGYSRANLRFRDFMGPEMFGKPMGPNGWTLDTRFITEVGMMAYKDDIVGNFRLYVREIGLMTN